MDSIVFAQGPDSTQKPVSGAISVTNNGISLVPAFTLDKPAAIFDLSVRKKRFSFEPEFAFGFNEAKPWYFVFWLRYKLVETSKFNMTISFHPGFLFATTNLASNGISKEYFTTSRFFVGALTPNYELSKRFSVGIYYQYARGYNSDLKQSNFLGVNGNLKDVSLGKKLLISAVAQIYYLKNDDKDGSYFNSTITLAKRDCPFSLSTLINKKVVSNISGHDFLWNISLTYTF
jgi:hypothetical protein